MPKQRSDVMRVHRVTKRIIEQLAKEQNMAQTDVVALAVQRFLDHVRNICAGCHRPLVTKRNANGLVNAGLTKREIANGEPLKPAQKKVAPNSVLPSL